MRKAVKYNSVGEISCSRWDSEGTGCRKTGIENFGDTPMRGEKEEKSVRGRLAVGECCNSCNGGG